MDDRTEEQPTSGSQDADAGPGSTVPVKDPRRTAAKIGFAAWIVVVTVLITTLLFHADVTIGPGRFSIGIRPSVSGETELVVTPLGALSGATHKAPVAVRLALEELHLAGSGRSTATIDRMRLQSQVRQELPGAVVRIGLTLLAASAVAGAIAAISFPGRRSLRRTAIGASGGVLTIALLVVPVVLTYQPDELLSDHQLEGPIASSDMLAERVFGFETRSGSGSSQVGALTNRIAATLTSRDPAVAARADGDVVLLHVSDLHLNSVGLQFARDLATRFNVDAVIDTGDFTSFGFAPEAEFDDQLKGFKIPYYLVPGNHDSPDVRADLKHSPFLHVLEDETVVVKGLRILGIADPTNTALQQIPATAVDRTYRDQFSHTKRLVASERPDLLLVHNPFQATPVVGKVPVAAAGHIHRTRLEVVGGTVVPIVGSSGATGLGDLLMDKHQPYTFDLLRFSNNKLVAVDQIRIHHESGRFHMRRRVIDPNPTDTATTLPGSAQRTERSPSRSEVKANNPKQLESVRPKARTPRTSAVTTTTAG